MVEKPQVNWWLLLERSAVTKRPGDKDTAFGGFSRAKYPANRLSSKQKSSANVTVISGFRCHFFTFEISVLSEFLCVLHLMKCHS